MIEKYGRDVISYYLAKGRTPEHLPSDPLPSPRETWDIVLQMPFEQRADLAKSMIFDHGIRSRQLARLLQNIPKDHGLSGGDVAHFIVQLLNDEEDRELHEKLCADLIDGFGVGSAKAPNLMGYIFTSPSLDLKGVKNKWSPTDVFHEALTRHASKAKQIPNYKFMADVFNSKKTYFRPELLAAYVNSICLTERRSLLLDMHVHRSLVSEDHIEGSEQDSHLDVFIRRFGQEFMTYCLTPVLHTVVDFNPKAAITLHNMIHKLGGNAFLKEYFELEPYECLTVASVMLQNEVSLKEFPYLKDIVSSNWKTILDKLNGLGVRLSQYALADTFSNCSKIVCENDPSQAASMIQFSLELMGYKGDDAIDKYIIDQPDLPFLSIAQGMGIKAFSESVKIKRENMSILPSLFPDLSQKEIISVFPQYKQHAISSDLGL